jgi:hypothetical protein
MSPPLRFQPERRRWLLGVGATLAGCTATPQPPPADEDAIEGSSWARACQFDGFTAAGPWHHRRYGNRRPTDYRATVFDGRPALHARSEAGNSLLRLPLQAAPLPPGARLRFSWRADALLDQADMKDPQADDAVARVLLSFDGDRQTWSRRDHMLSELAHLMTGEPLPYATLMYVWDNRYPVGTVIESPHTRRIRKLVVQNGPAQLGRWVEHERDVRADCLAAFERPAGPLTAVGLMTDANNLATRAEAWYGPLTLRALSLTTR